jgi:hypothetical protein
MTRDLGEITTLHQCQAEGILRYTSGSSHAIPPGAPPGYVLPWQATRWIVSGEFSFNGTSKTVFHDSQRIIINKSRASNLTACADHLHTLEGDSLDHEVYSGSSDFASLVNSERIAIASGSAPLVLIATQWSCSNVFHLLFDAVAKLELVEKLLGRDDCIALIPDIFIFKQVLSALSINYLAYDMSKRYTGDIFMPSMPHHTGIIPHETILFYQAKTRRLRVEACSKAIFVARKAGRARSIINQDELVASLNRICKLRIVYFEDLNVREQIMISKETDLIIGSHGAGFSWLVMNERKANMFEIFPWDYHNHCFQGLSYYFGAYGCHIADKMSDPSDSRKLSQDGFMVDIENCLRDFHAFYSKL